MAQIIAARLRLALALAAAALLLTACSALQLGYNQAHTVLYWWVDGYADLDDVQSVRLRQDIDNLLDWHRRTELPRYAQRLRQWQALAAGDLSADQVCAQADALRAATSRLIERGHEPLTRLALTLSRTQLDHLQRHQRKGNESFADEFLRGSPGEQLERRLERTLDRYETLYGALSDAQVALVRRSLQASPFDAALSLAQRRARQAELVSLIRQLQAAQGAPLGNTEPVPPAARQAMLGWLQRGLFASPGASSEAAGWVRHGCQAFADLHNTTSAQQRRHAQERLQGYETDLSALIAEAG